MLHVPRYGPRRHRGPRGRRPGVERAALERVPGRPAVGRSEEGRSRDWSAAHPLPAAFWRLEEAGETRLLFVAPFGLRRKGTTAYRILPLARALVARGHQITCIVPSWDSRADSGRRYDDAGVEVVHLRASPGPAAVAVAAECLQSVWRSSAADARIVHLFKPLGPPAAVALALQTRRALGPHRRLVLDTDDWEEGWARRAHSKLAPLVGLVERRLMRTAEAVTAASEALAQMASDVRRSGASVWHLPNGMPAPALVGAHERAALRATLGLADVPLLLLFTRYTECAPPRLVEVLSAVLARSPAARLLVVGTGFADEEERLRRGLEERGLAGRVHFAGWVPSAGLESYLSAADVALFPCDDDPVVRAKCSVKLVQLLGLGVPVVAEAVGSCRSYITHGQSGLLVAPGATADMADAVAALLASPEERERLGRGARDRVACEFGWEALAVRAEQAYASG